MTIAGLRGSSLRFPPIGCEATKPEVPRQNDNGFLYSLAKKNRYKTVRALALGNYPITLHGRISCLALSDPTIIMTVG